MINKKNNLLTKKKPITNKSNKYAIRKFTVGTASIVIGATLLFGLGHNEAKAEENSVQDFKDSNTDDELSDSNDQSSDEEENDVINNNQSINSDDNNQINKKEETNNNDGIEKSSEDKTKQHFYKSPLKIILILQKKR